MSDADIIKALECCAKDYCHTSECPIFIGTTSEDCRNELIKSALDLINRQKAELNQYAQDQHELMIEKDELFDIAEKQSALLKQYKAMIEKMKSIIDCYEETSGNKKARSEAITEFAERLKANAYTESTITGYRYSVVAVEDIDQIAKEMKEGVTDTNVGGKEEGEQ